MNTHSQSKTEAEVAGRLERAVVPNLKNTLVDRFEMVARKSDFVVLICIFITSLCYVLPQHKAKVDLRIQCGVLGAQV